MRDAMTRSRLFRTLGLAVLAVLVAVIALRGLFRSRDKAETPVRAAARSEEAKATASSEEVKTKVELDLGLVIWSGGQGETSLLVLRLWSGVLRQESLDNAAKKEGEKLAIKPLSVSFPKEYWEKAEFWTISGETAGPEGASKKLGGVVLVSSPESESAALGPRDTLTAMYRLPTAELPPPETLVRAEIKTEAGIVVSDPVPVPRAPESEKGRLLRKAEILLKLGSHSEAGLAAEEIMRRYPEEPAGYWIKAQVLEEEGLPEEALRLYRTALEKALALKEAESHEPPMPIILKIRMLEERLAGDKKPPNPAQ